MIRKIVPLLSVAVFFLTQACVKRLPAVSGGDKKVVAGHEMSFGSPEKIPEGGSVVWSMGDGFKYKGSQIRHAWHRPGKYQVLVTVTDPDGQTRKDSSTIEVTRPALLSVIPGSAGFVLLFKTPGEKLKNVPVLMEHLFSSSAEVNSTLAKIREMLGFDPFSSDGWRNAGVDPTGGVAFAGLNGGRDVVLVAGLLPGDRARKTIERLFLEDKQLEEKPAEKDSYITVVAKKGDPKAVELAYMDFRGHIWVSFADKKQDPKPSAPQKGPVQVLAELRSAGLQQGLDDNKGWFASAMASRKQEGAAELFMSREFMEFSNKEEVSSQQELAEDKAFIEKLNFVRVDLNLLPETIKAELRMGFVGKEAGRLAAVMRARNAVPAFRSTMAKQDHVAFKWSMNLPGLIEAIADISGEKEEWQQTLAAIDQFKAATGIDARADLLDNLGDSVMLAGRLKIAGILGLAGQGEKKRSLDDYVDASMLVQLKDSRRFFTAIDALSHVEGMSESIRPMPQKGARLWGVGPKELGIVLSKADSMAVLASSEAEVKASLARLAKPQKPDARWPETMDKPEYQVWGMDLLQLRKDIEAFEPSAKNASGLMMKNMIMMTLAGVGKLDMLVTNAVFKDKVLVVSGSLSMK